MNEIKLFEGHEVEVLTDVEIGGKKHEALFNTKHVGEVLGFSKDGLRSTVRDYNTKQVVTVKNSDVRNSHGRKLNNAGEKFLTESGVYKLAFRSNKEEAERFTDWVTDEVLPTIRKTGGYVNDDEMFLNTYLPHADNETRTMFKATLETVRKQNDQIEKMTPKAEYFDALVERSLLLNFRDTAKELHIKQKKFVNWLLDNDYVYRDQKNKLKPYSEYTPEYFELKEFSNNGITGNQTLTTPKGREAFKLLLKNDFIN